LHPVILYSVATCQAFRVAKKGLRRRQLAQDMQRVHRLIQST
jgi:hypothetical protein